MSFKTLSETAWLYICVSFSDINEPPTSIKLSNVKVSENSPKGTPVGTLSCEDPEQAYQNYTYSIIGPGSVPFTLGGKDNQILMVNGKLDYETGPIVDVIVRVTDSGGLFKEVTLKIQVQGNY